MPLGSLFSQRDIKTTHGSIRSRVPLRTPSGPQWTESKLELELLIQIEFAPAVSDVITQPEIKCVVDGKPKTYAPDIMIELYPGLPFQQRYFVIEVKRQAEVDNKSEILRKKFGALRDWCRANGMEYRIVVDRDIRGTYLKNVELLRHRLGDEPEDGRWGVMRDLVGAGSISVDELRQALVGTGWTYLDANVNIERAVATALLHCDLARPFTDETMVAMPTWDGIYDHMRTPVLKTIITSPSKI